MDEKRLRRGITASFICCIISIVVFAASIILMIYSIAIEDWIYFAAFFGAFIGTIIAILISRYIMDLGEAVIANHKDMDELLAKLKLKRDLDRGYEIEEENANNINSPHFILADINKVIYYVTEEQLSEIQIRTAYFLKKLFESALKAEKLDKLRILGSYEYKGHRFYDAEYASFVHRLREGTDVDIDDELRRGLSRIDSIIKFKEAKLN